MDLGAEVQALDGAVEREGVDQAAQGGGALAGADAEAGIDGETGGP